MAVPISAPTRDEKAEQQLTDIDSLINQGAKALIVLAKDSEAIKPAIAKATAAGIPVIAYDRLIEDPSTFYITFDNKKVGTLMAETLKGLVPSGNYAVILGAETDPNPPFLRSGMTEAGIPALGDTQARSRSCSRRTPTTGTPRTPATTWRRRSTRTTTTSRPSCRRTTAWRRASSRRFDAGRRQGPVRGQDGDTAALNRVALGTQAVSVWKNAFALGETGRQRRDAAVRWHQDDDVKAPSDLPRRRSGDLDAPGSRPRAATRVRSIILNPDRITKDNLEATRSTPAG